MHRHPIAFMIALTLFSSNARADSEAPNVTYVQSGEIGNCYAKSIPTEFYGSKGTTRIYLVREKDDELAFTFDWYARQIALLNTSKGVAVIRIGNWARGHEANKDELALAFYLNGKLLRSYSTLDIAGKPDNISRSVSHYTVIAQHLGFRWVAENSHAYDIKTTDGRTISFNIDTGEIIPPAKPSPR
jgi:hypothetical protein